MTNKDKSTEKLRALIGTKQIYRIHIKLTKSGFIDLNKLNIEIDLLQGERTHSRYKWLDDFEDSKIRSASSYQVTQFKIRVCDIKNVSEIRG